MATATDLLDAALETPSNLYTLWAADTLQARVTSFASDLIDDFPQDNADNHPIANWLAIIAAFAPTILSYDNGGSDLGQNTEQTFQTAVRYVYRICKLGYYYEDQGFITPAQAAAILAAYNARF